ncbi:unnamed protein product, partial [Onchocerca ochengi]
GGRTAHSALKLPLNIQLIENPTCNNSKTSGMGKVLLKCKLIVWDECTMACKKSIEALHRSLQDLRGNIKPERIDIVCGRFQTNITCNTSIDTSGRKKCLPDYFTFCRQVKTLKLTANMDIQLQNDRLAGIFSSFDTVVEGDEAVDYPTEFLNSLNLPGMPLHVLQLKIGMPIIMLRNINQPKPYNGTRLAVKKLMTNVVQATILTGSFKGEDVLTPRIPMIPTDMPFQFKGLQFPIR